MDTIIPSKPCTQCGEIKTLDEFSPLDKKTLATRSATSKQMGRRSRCKACEAKYSRDFHKAHGHKPPSKKYAKKPQMALKNRHKRFYNLSVEEYQYMYEKQGGLGAACKIQQTILLRSGKLKQLAVDHNHVTGKVRALLCDNCHQALGNLKEDPERVKSLLRYIEEYCL
jgi:hypothetical protein